MDILLIAATKLEIKRFLSHIKHVHETKEGTLFFAYEGHNITVCISGVGICFATYTLTELLLTKKFDFVINAGIAGAFHYDHEIG